MVVAVFEIHRGAEGFEAGEVYDRFVAGATPA